MGTSRLWRSFFSSLSVVAILACSAAPNLSPSDSSAPETKSSGATRPTGEISAQSPKPAVQISAKAWCTEPGLLLSRHEPRLLYGKRLPKPCCGPGVLAGEDAYRCTINWPAQKPFKCSVWKDVLDSVHRAGQDKGLMGSLTIAERKQLKRSGNQLVELYANRTHCQGENPLLKEWPDDGCERDWFDEKYKALGGLVDTHRSASSLQTESDFTAIVARGRACLGRIMMAAQTQRSGGPRGPRINPLLAELPFLLLDPIIGEDTELWLRAMQLANRHQMDRCVRRITGQNLVRVPIAMPEDSPEQIEADAGYQECLARCMNGQPVTLCSDHCRGKRLARYARWDAGVERPERECINQINGMRPLKFYGHVCTVFARDKLKAPARDVVKLDLEGHGLRPCMPYLLEWGMSEPSVADVVYEESLGKPNGGLIRRHFVEPARGTLQDLIDFTWAEARVSAQQEHGFHCMGMHFLDEREARLKGKPPRLKAMRPWKRDAKDCINILKKRASRLKLK